VVEVPLEEEHWLQGQMAQTSTRLAELVEDMAAGQGNQLAGQGRLLAGQEGRFLAGQEGSQPVQGVGTLPGLGVGTQLEVGTQAGQQDIAGRQSAALDTVVDKAVQLVRLDPLVG